MTIHAQWPLDGRYQTVVADPPWRYNDNLPGNGRGAAKHYPTLSLRQIEVMRVDLLAAPDAHLWLWATNSFLHAAFHVMDVWGFEYKTTLTWCKTQIGMGHYLRNTTEHCLLGVRGKLPAQGPRNIPSHFVAPRTQHSTKPQVAYDIISTLSPGPRIDLFARQEREGFDAWGLELSEK